MAEIKGVRGGEHASCRLYWRSLAVTVMSLCSLSLASTATTSICPADVPQSAVANSNSDQFFLDIDHPIECNGTVMAWKICYYLLSGEGGEGGEDIEETLFSVTVGVWKISGAWYRLVNYRLVEELGRDLQPGFNCITFPLLTTEQFSVKPGHLIGFHTHSVDSFEEVLQLHAVASSGEKLTKRKDSGFCQFSYPGLPVSLSCFENVTGAMHVHVIVEEFEGNEEPTSTTSSGPLSTTTSTDSLPRTTSENEQIQHHMTTATSTNSETIQSTTRTDPQTTEVSSPDLTLFVTTTLTAPNQNDLSDQAAAMGNRAIVVGTAVSTGGLVLITVILILIVVIIIVAVKYRQQNKLLNFNKTKKDGHRHIGLDHFVIVSDMSAVPPGSILSSPVSLEPHPYEESRTNKREISMVENPHVSTNSIGAALSNPIYGADDGNVYHTISSGQENEYEDPNKNEINCASYEVPVAECGAGERASVCKKSAAKPDYAMVIENQNAVDSEVVLDPQRYSALYQHYYKVVEEGNTEDKFMEPATNVEDLYAQVHKQKVKQLSEKDIKILELLGSGQFGNVSRGAWKSPKGFMEVAVKTLLAKEKNISRVKLLQEAAIMGQFFHPNVIKLLGVVTKKDSLMLVIELASKGDLKKHLVVMLPDPGELLGPDSDKLLLGYCQQVAFGMHYLGTKGFVHRDLAARNILITHDNILKIADFGMSRDLADESYYISQGGKVPVKWTAPEAINYLKYSTASDVWSYGCLLYEIWSLGQAPFTHCSNSEALDKLQTGYRLPPPPGCSRAIYSIMINCWHPEAQARPTFKDILLELHGQEDTVLKIPERDADTDKLANRVGGPLEAGEKMYTDLQWKYFTSDDYEEQV